MTDGPLKLALVLGGGGARGLAHLGVLQVFEREDLPVDCIVGTSVAQLTADGPLRTAESVGLGLAILDALERVHLARFVHRDLKPENLMTTPEGLVVILDLGLARKLPDGTPDYADPEVFPVMWSADWS